MTGPQDDDVDRDVSVSDKLVLAAALRWPELVGGALGTAVVGGSGHEIAGAAGASLGAVVATEIAARVRARREANVVSTLDAVAEMSHLSLREVGDRIVEDERLLHLGSRVLEEAARIAEDERRRALARTVANAIADGDVVEVEAVVARALIALEPPHVQVLARLSHPQPGSSAAFARWPIYSLKMLEECLPGAVEVLDPIMAVLEREGLVFAKGSTHFAKREWTITDFGRRCLRRLEDEGLERRRPESDRRTS
ncbi:MAG: hypothetical protein QOJ34_1116 [Pseudonocardiales bacterium]|jgi:hypothetical protein|nr:hypothetical protein [Pseudonocardiales bacterium]